MAFAVAFILSALLMLARNPLALFRAEFWAEDGVVFFTDAFTDPRLALWRPVTGYQMFASRAIAMVSTQLPLALQPYAYAGASWLIAAAVLAYFTREGFSWILPSKLLRVAVALLIATGPGSTEVFFNISNLGYIFCLWGMLLLLERPGRIGMGRAAKLALVFFSSGQALVLMPLLAYRYWRSRDRGALYAGGLLVAVFVLNSLSNLAFAKGHIDHPYAPGNWIYAPLVMLESFPIRLVLVPWIGAGSETFMMSPDWIFWSLSLVFFALLYRAARSASPSARENLRRLLVAFACAIGVLALVVIARAYNHHIIKRGTGMLLWPMRYSFLPAATALWFWVAYMSALPTRRAAVWGLRFTLLVFAFQNLRHWTDIPARIDHHWPELAARIEEPLAQKRRGELTAPMDLSELPIQPDGWKLRLRIEPSIR